MRDNLVTTVCGNRGTGKTDFLKELVKQTNLPKVLIVDTYDNSRWHTMETYKNPEWENIPIPVIPFEKLKYWKSGIYRIYSSDFDYMKSQISKYVTNTLLIFEDATKYFATKLTNEDKAILYDTKQKNVDAVYVFHSLRKANAEIVDGSDLLTLFHTADKPKRIMSKYEDDNILELYEQVKKNTDQYYKQTAFIN
ncbi:hypothetical protein [Brumimicrobium aurantiacum]|uniref:Zona occludens toxin N-terminal domain-containing protein n=1 Tax=Brumimicrobium aurantiacum TaxID=1737063 RepID=A0A3E1EZ66_9FLAO|nr:hypothetical protein [Brumimicrobium aurantiacum]RFC54861.1 hypothetical protein DXU93_03305 [Brumimicrobium aurantiacum]